jgi:hypothetical protein
MLDYQVRAVGYELGIDTKDSCERAFHLRGSVVLRLETPDGGVDERAQDGKVGEKCGTDAEVSLHDGLRQIVAAKRARRF